MLLCTLIAFSDISHAFSFFCFHSETGNDWSTEIQDSILEKCSNVENILSIVVEKKSNEVREKSVLGVDLACKIWRFFLDLRGC